MRRLFIAWGLFCGLSAANIAFAAGSASTAPASDFYLGLKAGGALGGKTLLDRLFITAAKSDRFAYTVPGLKIPFTAGLLSDRESMASVRDRGIDGANDWNTQAFGGYGLFRAGENLYIKGKAGLAHQRINIAGTTLVVDDDRSSMAVGLGAGMRLSNSRMELEYSWFNNANFLSVGYAF